MKLKEEILTLGFVDNLENIDITIPSFVSVILQYTSLDKNITYGDYLIRKHENLLSVLTKIISSDTHYRKYRIPEGSTISSILDRSNLPVSLKINGIMIKQTSMLLKGDSIQIPTTTQALKIVKMSF